jgi:hypothetical protein
MDGCVVEIDGGSETLRLGPPMVVFGALEDSPPGEIERLRRARWEYRFVGVEDVQDPEDTDEAARRAVFELVEPTQDVSVADSGGEPGA